MLHIQSFEFSPIQENTYVLYNDQKQCAIIDPGCYFQEERDALHQFIQNNSLQPMLLVNTHCHLDHVFGNKFVAETFHLTLHIHPLEKQVLDYAPTSGLMYNLPFDQYEGEIHYINDGDQLSIGTESLQAILVPGHSPGSLAFYSAADQFVISGDALFYRSIGRTDLPLGDHAVLLKSIKEKLFVLPEQTMVYSGHGKPTRIGEEKTHNPFLK
jgi:glyoxylase-like metal-dependent hydrolase (beta-lactamase superfamily II)